MNTTKTIFVSNNAGKEVIFRVNNTTTVQQALPVLLKYFGKNGDIYCNGEKLLVEDKLFLQPIDTMEYK